MVQLPMQHGCYLSSYIPTTGSGMYHGELLFLIHLTQSTCTSDRPRGR